MKKTNYVRVNKLPMNKLLTTITLLCFSIAAIAQLTPPQSTGEAFTLKLLKRTGENFFSSLAYECNDCSFEQFENLDQLQIHF